jgi:oligoendopeptidase F
MTPLFPTVAHWEAEAAAVSEGIAEFRQYRGRLGSTGGVLLACLEAQDALGERMLKVARYASNTQSADGLAPESQAMAARAGALGAKVSSALAFIPAEVRALEDEAFAALFAGTPGLNAYRHHLESLRATRAHSFAPETESVLAALSEAFDAPHTIYKAIAGVDMRFPAVTDTDGEPVAMSVARYARLAQSPDREVRRRAYDSLAQGLGGHKAALATSLANHINKAVTLARLRGYNSALEGALAASQVPVSVYDNVLDTILTEAAPHVQRYMRLRQRVLGLDHVMRYDMTAPLDPTYDATLGWDEGTGLIKEGLAVLGPEYGAMLDRAFAERWVDRADNEGKAHGAFNSGIYGWHPVIMMTWQDKARDTFTLAHELGHCGHRFLSSQNQNLTNSGLTNIGRFFLEAPSTANEALLGSYLLAQDLDVRRRRYTIEAFLGTFMHNMVTHLLEAALERALFALAEGGTPITLKVVMQTQGDVMAGFFGDSVTIDEGARLTWTTVPHFYMGFYPLVYAAGLAAGCAMAEAIRREGEPAVERWLTTLKAGSTMHPLDLYRQAGIDMASPEPVREAVALFGRLVADLEACYN